jgi:hypothetical protein
MFLCLLEYAGRGMKDKPSLETTRADNDARWSGQLEQIRRGDLLAALDPFAKAYLGLFLAIDRTLSPERRVREIAGPDLAQAALEGMVAAVNRGALPSPATIGTARVQRRDLPETYVVLAGADMLAQSSPDVLLQLPAETLASILCLHYANASEHAATWVSDIVHRRQDVSAPALRDFWLELVRADQDFLPGFEQVLKEPDLNRVLAETVVPLLREWTRCTDAVLKDLLHAAMCCADHYELLAAVEEHLRSEPLTKVRRRVYWLAAAFLMEPQRYGEDLLDVIGRTREKVMRLLDFVYPMLANGFVHLPPMELAHLIRIIAPIIRPHHDSRDRDDDNMPKVLWLIDALGRERNPDAEQAIQWLHEVRVMRVYQEALERARDAQRIATKEA